MRQHVNPLSRFFQVPFDLPNSAELFEFDDRPLHLDIGSARGKYLIEMAHVNNNWNYIGVEIREALVICAEKERIALDLNNLRFLFCNANVSLVNWLSFLRYDQLQRVTIQFPDPWFKRRHYKRRVLQPDLLTSLARNLKTGRELFIQSDIYELIDAMSLVIEESNYFDRVSILNSKWLDSNPYGVCTEREMYVMKQGSRIYRALYARNSAKIWND